MRSWSLPGFCVLCTLLARSAAAEEVRQRCIAAFEEGQRLELRAELPQAAQKFAFCSSEPCPGKMHAECRALLDEVQTSMPSIAFSVKVSSNLAASVWVSIDDAEPQPYAGETLHVGLGKHEFAFGCDGCRTTVRRVLFSDATPKRKEVELSAACAEPIASAKGQSSTGTDTTPTTVPALPPQSRAASQRSIREPTQNRAHFVHDAAFASTTALAALGAIGFVGFGLQARNSDRNLDLCAPGCTRAQVASVKREYFWANAALGTGLVALLGTGLLLTLQPASPSAAGNAGSTRRMWALRVGPITTLTAAF